VRSTFIQQRSYRCHDVAKNAVARIGKKLKATTLSRGSSTTSNMSKKNEKIKRLFDRGITDPRLIAQKLGYKGNAMVAGIDKVNEALRELGITLL